ncbi:glutathione S-transferase 1-1-like [Schistocerca nitens]|uniref:glutathione S-transferase 1-1-like n=1 Tax=Schistocerca nitens TaxID=7011 RepID=UPI002117F120|nr:glutathione S-transferase 1-1-like [Schistocerca nitens]XP_049803078.1 glutathione S-transferase 1-1-like [Schistocerca nitens]
MATLDFYGEPGSPPCRTVKMVAAAIGVKLNSKFVDLDAKEHLKPEFLKMNPQHTIPTIDDNGFYLWESRAIAAYLVDQYAKDDSMYPKDAKKRALVNQRLFFDLSTLYGSFADYYYPVLFYGAPKFDPEKFKKIEQAYDFLNTFLEGKEWVAGMSMTIADYSMVSSVGAAEAVGFDYKKYSNVLAWFERAKKAIKSYDEIYHPDAMVFKKWYDDAGAGDKK